MKDKKGYIDMHSHLLWGVDDGAKTEDESLYYLHDLKCQGVDTAVLTPHMNSPYILGGCADEETLRRRFAELKDVCEKDSEKYPKLILGSEYHYDIRCDKNYRGGSDTLYTIEPADFHPITMGQTDWVLLELPWDISMFDLLITLKSVARAGYRAILAHPEKCITIEYEVLKSSFMSKLRKYYGRKIYVQNEAWDIANNYEMARWFVKNKITTVIGTDSHGEHRPPVFNKAVQRLDEIVEDKDYLSAILSKNAETILKCVK